MSTNQIYQEENKFESNYMEYYIVSKHWSRRLACAIRGGGRKRSWPLFSHTFFSSFFYAFCFSPTSGILAQKLFFFRRKIKSESPAMHCKRYLGWRTQAAWAKKKEEEKSMWKQWPASLPSTTTGGTRKPPGPKCEMCCLWVLWVFLFWEGQQFILKVAQSVSVTWILDWGFKFLGHFVFEIKF